MNILTLIPLFFMDNKTYQLAQNKVQRYCANPFVSREKECKYDKSRLKQENDIQEQNDKIK